MKIIVAGAGAMGSRFGLALLKAGYNVFFVDEWEEHVEALQKHGLKVNSEKGIETYPVYASTPEKSKGPCDLFIILTKAMQTKQMMEKCQYLIDEKTSVLTIQNGLGNLEVIKQYVPEQNLFAGVTTYASRLIGPGKIEAFGLGETELMQVNNKKTKNVTEIINLFNHAGIQTAQSENVIESIWKKAAFNSILNPLCTLMQNTVSSVGSYSNIEILLEELMNEIIFVARAEKVSIVKSELNKMIQDAFDPNMSGNHFSSMYQDVNKGRKTEIEHLNGAIVHIAEKHHISVPNHKLIYHLISMLEETAGESFPEKTNK